MRKLIFVFISFLLLCQMAFSKNYQLADGLNDENNITAKSREQLRNEIKLLRNQLEETKAEFEKDKPFWEEMVNKGSKGGVITGVGIFAVMMAAGFFAQRSPLFREIIRRILGEDLFVVLGLVVAPIAYIGHKKVITIHELSVEDVEQLWLQIDSLERALEEAERTLEMSEEDF